MNGKRRSLLSVSRSFSPPVEKISPYQNSLGFEAIEYNMIPAAEALFVAGKEDG
jgi:hypothetical protein